MSNRDSACVLEPADLAAHLQAGGAALFPTDTLPALAARPQQAFKLWQLKARPADKPLILMGADLGQLLELLLPPGSPGWPQAWLEKARSCWPGAVTLVLPIQGETTDALNPGGFSLGLRVPDCGLARELLRCTGPLATTSVNRSGEPAALDADEAAARFPGLPRLAPLPWPAGSGRASTVLAWQAPDPSALPKSSSQAEWRLLRSGATISADMRDGAVGGCSG
jgi:L-threonylcarbamoyladenylate synthase